MTRPTDALGEELSLLMRDLQDRKGHSEWLIKHWPTVVHALVSETAPVGCKEKLQSGTPRMDATLGKGADWIFAEGCRLERELAAYKGAWEEWRSLQTGDVQKLFDAAMAHRHAAQSATQASERNKVIEECARVCETSYTTFEGFPTEHGKRIANAIRALSSGSEREGKGG